MGRSKLGLRELVANDLANALIRCNRRDLQFITASRRTGDGIENIRLHDPAVGTSAGHLMQIRTGGSRDLAGQR